MKSSEGKSFSFGPGYEGFGGARGGKHKEVNTSYGNDPVKSTDPFRKTCDAVAGSKDKPGQSFVKTGAAPKSYPNEG